MSGDGMAGARPVSGRPGGVRSQRGPTQSGGAGLIAGGAGWIVTRSGSAVASADRSASMAAAGPQSPRLGRTSLRDERSWAVAVTLAWASHVLLDWLSNDT